MLELGYRKLFNSQVEKKLSRWKCLVPWSSHVNAYIVLLYHTAYICTIKIMDLLKESCLRSGRKFFQNFWDFLTSSVSQGCRELDQQKDKFNSWLIVLPLIFWIVIFEVIYLLLRVFGTSVGQPGLHRDDPISETRGGRFCENFVQPKGIVCKVAPRLSFSY